MTTRKKSPVLASFGNPLLDIIVHDEDGTVVDKYGLEKNVAQEMDTDKTGLYEDVISR